MQQRVRDFIYLDTERYISLESLKIYYWATIILPIYILVVGIVSKSLFLVLSVALYSFSYWVFVGIIQTKRVKKTFALRFLVNGIFGILLRVQFWIILMILCMYSDLSNYLGIKFLFWAIMSYLIFLIIYSTLIVVGIHKGIYAKIKENSKTKTAISISIFFASALPGAGVFGIRTSRLLQETTSEKTQFILVIYGILLVIFLSGLSHVNFIMYFYCKKYKITCDENGNYYSYKLQSNHKTKKFRNKKEKKKLPLILKILLAVVSIPISIFLVFFIIEIIQSIIH